MFLLRMMFWLGLVIMIMPTGQQADVDVSALEGRDITVDGAIGAAAATVSDMASFCERNTEVCETGSAAFKVFLAKAENSARLVYRMASGTDSTSAVSATDGDVRTRDATYRRSPSAQLPSRDTLRSGDLEPEWHGPQGDDA